MGERHRPERPAKVRVNLEDFVRPEPMRRARAGPRSRPRSSPRPTTSALFDDDARGHPAHHELDALERLVELGREVVGRRRVREGHLLVFRPG